MQEFVWGREILQESFSRPKEDLCEGSRPYSGLGVPWEDLWQRVILRMIIVFLLGGGGHRGSEERGGGILEGALTGLLKACERLHEGL